MYNIGICYYRFVRIFVILLLLVVVRRVIEVLMVVFLDIVIDWLLRENCGVDRFL